MSVAQVKTTQELRQERRREPAETHDDLLVACLWPKDGTNLGTLLRTCDAVGVGLVIPATANARQAIRKGNTIGVHNSPVVYFTEPPLRWLLAIGKTHWIVGVELAWGAASLAELPPSTDPTVVVLGHEVTGIPQEAMALLDQVVEIPMTGVGNSLNVAVVGSLVLYKLRGLM